MIQTGQLEEPAADPAPQAQPSDRPATRTRSNTYNRDDLWAWFETRKQSIKDEALRRAGICNEVRRLIESGLGARASIAQVAAATEGVTEGTLRNWWYGTSNILGASKVDKSDYAPALAPRYHGSTKTADICEEAWAWIYNDYMRLEAPTAAAVIRRARKEAKTQGWTLPSNATIKRRLDAIDWKQRVLAREGTDALLRKLPHVTRSKAHLHAMQAVNADGHTFDVLVKLPSGEIGRPVMCAWQDLYSGKLLSYRISETLNWHTVRLSFGDMVDNYGIPHEVFLDNGREFANKFLSGQLKHRFRFKIREDEPEGVFKALSIGVHWTTPYHGQSKPIERMFLDLCCEQIAKHPACAGAYTGNSPTNKPANYGAKAMEWDDFLKIVAEQVEEHNARQGRRSEVCRGRSFNDVFEESRAKFKKLDPTPEQRRLFLLACEGVKVRDGGHIELQRNLYWNSDLGHLKGKKVIARFDPDDLTKAVHIYSLDNQYQGTAEVKRVNFIDSESATEHNRQNRRVIKHTKKAHEAQVRKDLIEEQQRIPDVVIPMAKPKPNFAPIPEPACKVVGGWALEDDQDRPDERRMLELLPFLPRRTEDDE
ncbi:MAG: Mu transposase C-terminal domain-containing protein [Candidatus Sericytochromatia bacterium]|nr:Mu transposase C-terminal domain-containing protein [Candidatus Sericytochromatia bacterium]